MKMDLQPLCNVRWVAPLAVLAFVGGCIGETTETPVTVSLVQAEARGGGGAPPKVNSTDPTGSVPDVTLDVRVIGSGYDDQSAVDFLLAGGTAQDVTVNSTAFVSSSELVANVTIGATAIETFYDVAVTTGRGKKGVGIELFEINSLLLRGQGGDVVTTFRDGTDRIRSDHDDGSGSRQYTTISRRSAVESRILNDGRHWLEVRKNARRDLCVDFPESGPDAVIVHQGYWDELVTISGGDVGLGQRLCGYMNLHTRTHADSVTLLDIDADPSTSLPDVTTSGGRLIFSLYDGAIENWAWRLEFDDRDSQFNGGLLAHGLCIRVGFGDTWTLGSDPTIEADAENPGAGVCSAVDEYVNLIHFDQDIGARIHVARFRMPFRYTLRPE